MFDDKNPYKRKKSCLKTFRRFTTQGRVQSIARVITGGDTEKEFRN